MWVFLSGVVRMAREWDVCETVIGVPYAVMDKRVVFVALICEERLCKEKITFPILNETNSGS